MKNAKIPSLKEPKSRKMLRKYGMVKFRIIAVNHVLPSNASKEKKIQEYAK